MLKQHRALGVPPFARRKPGGVDFALRADIPSLEFARIGIRSNGIYFTTALSCESPSVFV
jgi:hypothetical protein